MSASARTVRFGFGPWSTGVGDSADVLRYAVQADRAGLDLFTLSDHPHVGGRLDAYAVLGVVLGSTSHLTAAVNVTNLPSRPAPMLARSITSLSALSGGRVALGLGAGGSADDIVRLGVPRLTPGQAVRALEEAVTVIRKLSGGGAPVTFEGEFTTLHRAEPSPVPAPPVWTGSVGPKSLAVTGRVADGWFPGHASDWASELYRESRPRIDEAAAAAGRDPADIETIFNLPGRITDHPLPRTRDEDGRWAGGSVTQWVEELTSAVLEHGAGGFVFFDFADPAPTDVSLGRWATEIVPAVREALSKG
ncbi:LLM class flavin-dependent oxidoreductase [Streptomyces cyaneofuscatus]|uniref:LLM class flavin-dependent oxidoreductase n=1 Tax=Streptomyces cyaneofuscatus TaxID=66883 RepID=UPI00386A8066|nr:LLM class flavin-dependent oxidoreductase [Streptomyces cyaneofuscatus]